MFSAAGKTALRWSEMVEGIMKSADTGRSGAIKRFDAGKKLGVITRDMVGSWGLAA